MTNPEILRYTQETGDFSRMLESIPYARFIGLECDRYGAVSYTHLTLPTICSV